MSHSITTLPHQTNSSKHTNEVSGTYENLSQNKLETRDKKEVYTQVSNSPNSKYRVTLEFLGTVDSQQVESEIITILKGQFLSKITTSTPNTQALQSLTVKEKGGTKE